MHKGVAKINDRRLPLTLGGLPTTGRTNDVIIIATLYAHIIILIYPERIQLIFQEILFANTIEPANLITTHDTHRYKTLIKILMTFFSLLNIKMIHQSFRILHTTTRWRHFI